MASHSLHSLYEALDKKCRNTRHPSGSLNTHTQLNDKLSSTFFKASVNEEKGCVGEELPDIVRMHIPA